MLGSIRNIWIYLVLICLAILTGTIAIVLTEQVDLHLKLISSYNAGLDLFFKYFTEIGHGLVCSAIILIAAALQRKHFLPLLTIGLTAYALSGLLTQFLKRVVFTDAMRPKKLIGEDALHLIDGVRLNEYFSFPSGHSTSTLALFTFLALVYYKKKWAQICLAALAVVGAYSRVYTSQHFLEDIVAGAVIGTLTTLFVWWIYSKYTFKKFFAYHSSGKNS